MERADEIRALGSLTGDALAGAVGIVEDMHRAIATRVDSALPPTAKPVTAIVALSTAATYLTVRAAHRWIPRGAAAIAVAISPADAPSLTEKGLGRMAVATLNGLLGPTITDPVALTAAMTLHHDGRILTLDIEPLSVQPFAAGAGGNLVVFIHGLAETAASWAPVHAPDGTRSGPYPEQLDRTLGTTSLCLSYNSGRAIPDNGAEFADLMEQLVDQWPVPLESITLIGHSMGGLLARSAVHRAELSGQSWVDHLRLIVTLGTPHLGAPLEKVVHLAEQALGRFPETAALARPLAGRSPGVRDLRHGRVHHDSPDDAGAVQGDSRASGPAEARTASHVTYCTVATTVTRDQRHPMGRLIGDGLVRLPSASGKGRTRVEPFHVDARLGGVFHLALLRTPAVLDLVRDWVSEFALTPAPA